MQITELMNQIEEHIIVWNYLICPSKAIQMIQPDAALIDEARCESFKAIYDIIRNFEDNVRKSERNKIMAELSNRIAGKQGDEFISEVAAMIARS